MFNKTFRELYIERQKTNPASLTTVKLAFGFSSSDGGNARSICNCSYPASGNSAPPEKNWFQKRAEEKPSGLDSLAHGRTKGVSGPPRLIRN